MGIRERKDFLIGGCDTLEGDERQYNSKITGCSFGKQ